MKYLVALAILISNSCHSGYVDRYNISSINGKKSFHANWDIWQTYIYKVPSEQKWSSATLEFDFTSYGYFTESNIGHFTIGIGRTSTSAISGKGVVIGNVSQYLNSDPLCNPSLSTNAVVIESYWFGGNCVYGETESISLMDGVKYHLTVTANSNDNTIEYQLSDNGRIISHYKKVDYFWSMSDNSSGWWINEVFSTHSWVVVLEDIKWRYE